VDKIESYNRWHNPNHGFELQPDVNGGPRITTENGILYQSEFVMLQDIIGTLDDMDKSRFSRTVDALELEPGLYCRSRQEKSEDSATRRTISQDNIDGIVYGGLICGTDRYSKDVAKYALKHFGIFNNTSRFVLPLNPGNFFDWFLSGGYFILSIFFLPVFIINYLLTIHKDKNNTSSKKLYLLCLYAMRKTKIMRYFYRHFCEHMVEMYGEEFISEIYKIYYPAEHPLNFFAKGIKYTNGVFTK
jgi:hypothetical protein